MTEALGYLTLRFGFVMVRVGACVSALPLMGQAMSIGLRATIILALSIILVMVVPFADPLPEQAFPLAFALLGEVIIGVAIGTCARLILVAAEFAGQVLGVPMGIGFMNVVDPLSGQSLVVTSRFLAALTVLVFLVVGGHHIVIRGLSESFFVWPAGQGIPSGLLGHTMHVYAASVIRSAVQLAAPILISLLAVKLGLGIIARSTPKIKVFFIGFSLAILVGVTVMMVTAPQMVLQMTTMVSSLDGWIARVLESAVTAP